MATDAQPLPETSPEDNLTLDTATVDPVLEEYQTEAKQDEWKKELQAARDERAKFDSAGVTTVERYADIRNDREAYNRFNLFHSNTDIKLSSLYSRTPEADIRRRFMDSDDDPSRVASNLLQRCVAIELDRENFDQKFKQTLFDYLVPGLGVLWVRYEDDKDDEGNITDQRTAVDYAAWDDILFSPCQVWTDCRWVARRIPMNKRAVENRFGSTAPEDVISAISYEVKKENKVKTSTDALKPKNIVKQTADIYEIWDKEEKLICWVHEGSRVPLDVKEATDELPDFFPTPLPPLGNYTTASTIPRSDYSQVQDLYDMLDKLQEKAAGYIDAIAVRFVYDGEFKELADIFSLAEFKGLPISKWAQFIEEKGGLIAKMQFVPIKEYVDALTITLANIETVKRQIFEVEGIADFMRGETQKYDPAAAIQQKGSFAATRLGTRQKKVALYCEKVIRLMVHYISKFYAPETIVDHAGALPPDDTQHLAAAVQLIKSNFHSNFRLSVSVDSLQDAQWNVEKAERTAVVNTLGQMIVAAGPVVQAQPKLGPLFVQLIRFAVAGYKGADAIEGVLDSALNELLRAGSEEQPKQPSKEEIKAGVQAQKNQTDLQISRETNQTKIAIAQSEAQSRAVNDQLESKDQQLRTAAKVAEVQSEAVEASQKHAREMLKLQIDARKP